MKLNQKYILTIISLNYLTYVFTKDLHGYVHEDSTTFIQQQAGCDVQLICGIRENHVEFLTSSNVIWDFKPCGEAYNQTSCRNINEADGNNENWTKIECDDQPCKATLIIKNPNESDSGLYRCSIQPYKPNKDITLHIQIIKTYQLDIINFTNTAPDLLDDLPKNTTARLDSQVVLQCRVHSKLPPSIKWFRKQETTIMNNNEMLQSGDNGNNDNFRVIQYFQNTYEVLVSAGEKGLTEDTYLSKLIINNVSERDVGIYVCVGINYRGYKLREAYLNIDYSDEQQIITQKRDLLLLFLIPIGLALIPVLIWICYLIMKSRNNNSVIENKRNIRTDYHHITYIDNNMK